MIEWMQLMGSVLRGEDNMNFNSQIECEAAFLYLNSGKSRDLCGFSGHTNCSCRNKQESFLYLQMTLTLGALKWSISFELLKWIIRIFLHVILRKLEASCFKYYGYLRHGMCHLKDLYGKRKKIPSKHSLGYSPVVPCPFAAYQCNISFSMFHGF